ncbi:hypothetical protein [Roseibium sp.]|uniref:hypothetical protein n=1 Tax=Roseibium sp. TaxID=1936156 RepID=UPI003B51D9F1
MSASSALQVHVAGAAKTIADRSGMEPESGLRFTATVGQCAAEDQAQSFPASGMPLIGSENRTARRARM